MLSLYSSPLISTPDNSRDTRDIKEILFGDSAEESVEDGSFVTPTSQKKRRKLNLPPEEPTPSRSSHSPWPPVIEPSPESLRFIGRANIEWDQAYPRPATPHTPTQAIVSPNKEGEKAERNSPETRVHENPFTPIKVQAERKSEVPSPFRTPESNKKKRSLSKSTQLICSSHEEDPETFKTPEPRQKKCKVSTPVDSPLSPESPLPPLSPEARAILSEMYASYLARKQEREREMKRNTLAFFARDQEKKRQEYKRERGAQEATPSKKAAYFTPDLHEEDYPLMSVYLVLFKDLYDEISENPSIALFRDYLSNAQKFYNEGYPGYTRVITNHIVTLICKMEYEERYSSIFGKACFLNAIVTYEKGCLSETGNTEKLSKSVESRIDLGIKAIDYHLKMTRYTPKQSEFYENWTLAALHSLKAIILIRQGTKYRAKALESINQALFRYSHKSPKAHVVSNWLNRIKGAIQTHNDSEEFPLDYLKYLEKRCHGNYEVHTPSQ